MSKRFRSAAAAAIAMAFIAATPAGAAEPGWYFGGEAGGSFLDDGNNSIETDPSFNPGTPGGALIVIPGIIELFPIPGEPGEFVPGQQNDFQTSYEDGFLGGLTLGYLYPSGIRTEFELRYAQNDIDEISVEGGNSASSDGELNSTAAMANVWYDFNQDGNWHPYLGAGIGAAKVDVEDVSAVGGGDGFESDDTVFAYQGGVGINYDLTERTVIDLGYRYFATDDPSFRDSGQTVDVEYEQQVALLSLRYTFSPAERPDSDGDGVADINDKCPNTPKGAPVGADGCPLDSDGDGVPDYLDKCPGTPEGVPVNEDGCPKDSDGDGVPDYKDECPNTPKGTQVNDKGCPLVVDSDGDGVPDDQDLCPDTPPGQPVLTNGCAVGQSAILQGVNFEFDSAKLTSSARDILLDTAQQLKDSPGFKVEIAGHTDSKGAASYNKDLSQRRADSVKDFLVAEGVSPDRLDTMGYGESQPIAPNTNDDGSDNPEGRAMNRRVELSVVDREGPSQ